MFIKIKSKHLQKKTLLITILPAEHIFNTQQFKYQNQRITDFFFQKKKLCFNTSQVHNTCFIYLKFIFLLPSSGDFFF